MEDGTSTSASNAASSAEISSEKSSSAQAGTEGIMLIISENDKSPEAHFANSVCFLCILPLSFLKICICEDIEQIHKYYNHVNTNVKKNP